MISAIYNRQSIRKFIDKPISQEDIIDNGMKAPSSKNRPPWNYTVVKAVLAFQ
uniref:nitroreductase family protein n=1 Tax=Enterocloster clostridioformis TaxID=1531 RepID=UPI001C3DCD25|nr:nitroreductase family protein [Enterocloster clostridioformis]